MRRSNLVLAVASAVVGGFALALTVAAGGGAVGYVLGAILLLNAVVRYRIAQRE
jgi:hypothetical protein